MSGLCVRAGGSEDPNAGLGDWMQLKNHSFIAGRKQKHKPNQGKHKLEHTGTIWGYDATLTQSNTGLKYTEA